MKNASIIYTHPDALTELDKAGLHLASYVKKGAVGVIENEAGLTLYVHQWEPTAESARFIADAGFRRFVAYCGQITASWRADADEAEKELLKYGIECLFVMD